MYYTFSMLSSPLLMARRGEVPVAIGSMDVDGLPGRAVGLRQRQDVVHVVVGDAEGFGVPLAVVADDCDGVGQACGGDDRGVGKFEIGLAADECRFQRVASVEIDDLETRETGERGGDGVDTSRITGARRSRHDFGERNCRDDDGKVDVLEQRSDQRGHRFLSGHVGNHDH
jgi:hypothetical protein